MKILYCIILIIYNWVPIYATVNNSPTLTPFWNDNELKSGAITSISQDSYGQMWITTGEYLYSFDGYNVQKIKLEPPATITVQTELQCVLADSKNRIWIGSGSCIYCYDQDRKTYTHYFPAPEDVLNMSNVIYQIAEAPSGTLFFATRNGIFMFDENSKKLHRHPTFPWHKICKGDGKNERIALCIHITSDGILWCGTQDDGLWCINLKDNKGIHFKNDPNDPKSLEGNYIQTLYEDRLGVIWIGTTKGLSIFHKESSTFTNISFEKTPVTITTIGETSDNRLILGSPEGIYFYNRKTQETKKALITSYPQLSSFSNNITHLKKDRSGGVWIGTKKGLLRSYSPHEFQLLQHNEKNTNSLSSNKISFLTADEHAQNIWITHANGNIDLYTPATGHFKRYSLHPYSPENMPPLAAYLTPDQKFIVATDIGLFQYDSSKDSFLPLQFPFTTENFKNTYALFKDRKDNLWIGILDKGLFKVNVQQQSCERIPISYEKIHKNIYTNIKVLFEDKQGDIWIVFWRAGILRFSPKTGEEKLFTTENTNGQLPNNTIWDIKEDHQDRLILATAGGLAVWDPTQQKFTSRQTMTCLTGESIVSIESNTTDSLWWLATTKGIVRLNPANGNLIRYSESDGLQGNIFNPRATAKLNSLFFFGGDYGLNIINTDQPAENTYIPHPHLTTILINGIETDPDLLPKENGLPILKLKKNDIAEIGYSSFSYRKEWRNYYKTGFQHNDSMTWEQPHQKNKVTFTATNTGNTQFLLCASNSDGLWSEPQTMLTIQIGDPHQTILYFILALILSGGIIFIFRKKIIQKIKKQRKQQNRNIQKTQTDIPTLQLQEKFTTLMENEQLYQNKRFSKIDLANLLKINEQQLTVFLKTCYGKGFPELINYYRVEAVKRKMEDPRNKDYTLFALGEECGFNSRSSFYRIFKEHTGLTPAEYQEKLKDTIK